MSLTGFNHNLQWSEFREVNQRPANVSEDAQIVITANPQYAYGSQPNQDCRITTINTNISVNRPQSWVVRGRKSTELLSHELGHYDITALGSREIHQRVSNITATKCRPDMDNEARRINSEVQLKINNANIRYDSQTNHGQNATAQTRWDNSIRSAKQRTDGTIDNLPS
jgi:predicted secreted Zn-dependent protease